MIRLLLAAATACAVVWLAGAKLGALSPSDDARAALERTARVAREEAAELLAPEPAERQALPQAETIPEPAEFAPEPALPTDSALEQVPGVVAGGQAEPGVLAGELGWNAPLDAQQAEAVRSRLDRVMSLASGSAE